MSQSRQQRDNSGVLFKNERKQSDKHPDFQGSICVNGQEFWLSAWLKMGNKGRFFSLSVKKKEGAQRTATTKPPTTNAQPDLPGEDDVPF